MLSLRVWRSEITYSAMASTVVNAGATLTRLVAGVCSLR